MAKKKDAQYVKFVCGQCKQVNYFRHKNVRKVERKLEFKKYCKHCKKSTVHKEGKK